MIDIYQTRACKMATIQQIREIVGPNTIRFVYENRLQDYGYDKLRQKLKDLTDAFYHQNSQWLSLNELLPHVQLLLIDPVFMRYTLENIDKDTAFHQVYKEVFVDGRVYFERIKDPFKQFALGWLYTRYH